MIKRFWIEGLITRWLIPIVWGSLLKLILTFWIVDDDFIYEDEEEDEIDVDVENGYYNAKGVNSVNTASVNPLALKEDDPKAAINEFRTVVETEAATGEKGDW